MARSRFVAGAVCPACGEMDRIVIKDPGEAGARRHCVACGFSDAVPVPGGRLPGTRLTRSSQPEPSALSRVRIVGSDQPLPPDQQPEDGEE